MQDENKFGSMGNSKESLENYKKGDWIRFYSRGNAIQAKKGEINKETGEISFDAIIQGVFNEKGYVIEIVEKTTTFKILDIDNHRIASEEEIKATIENQGQFFNRIGKYVAISACGSTFTGKVDKIFSSYVELKPAFNYKNGQPYIEEEEPISVPISVGVCIMPRTREDLEYMVKEMTEAQSKSEKKE